MSEMSYLKVFLDWTEATRKLKDAEKGRLIDALVAYARGDEDADSRLTGNEAYVFPVYQLQIDRDKAELSKQSQTNSENGKKGGAPKGNQNARKNNRNQPKTTGNNRNNPDYDYDHDYDHDHSIPPIPPAGGTGETADADFERFWAEYPRKQGKGAARTAFQKARKKTTLDAMLSAVRRQKASWDWTKDGGQYVPQPATWLNQERWGDELNAGPPQASNGGYQGGGYGGRPGTDVPSEWTYDYGDTSGSL